MSLTSRTVERTLADRYAAAEGEIEALVDATYRVIAATGTVDPTMRQLLAEAEISTQAFYRHFRSKDELLVVVLDDGRRRLVDYLAARIARETTADGRVETWIRGVLAQATDPEAATRTRPFVANLDRLSERYADEQRQSEDLLIDQVASLLDTDDPQADAGAVYHLAFGAMQRHLRHRTTPTDAEIDHLVAFAVGAINQARGNPHAS